MVSPAAIFLFTFPEFQKLLIFTGRIFEDFNFLRKVLPVKKACDIFFHIVFDSEFYEQGRFL